MRNIGFSLYSIQHQLLEGLRLHVQGGKGLLVSVSYVPGVAKPRNYSSRSSLITFLVVSRIFS